MAKVIISFTDKEPTEDDDGNVGVEIVFDPPVTETTGCGTAAQQCAMQMLNATRSLMGQE